MDLRTALKGQYRAGLKMLRLAVERCPEDMWLCGESPRLFCRIAGHAIFYTHLYLMQKEADFEPWLEKSEDGVDLWGSGEGVPTYTKEQILGYIDHVDANVATWVDRLDLDAQDSGFHWYANFPKLDHQILNIRHLGGHVGQLHELLMARGIDVDWVSRV